MDQSHKPPATDRPAVGQDGLKFPLLLAVLAALSTLAACVPNLGPAPEPSLPISYATEESFSAVESGWPSERWWEAYGDPELNKLVDEALAGAPDMKIAEARFRQAAASEQQAGAALWPTITLDGSIQPTQQSLNGGFPPQIQTFLPKGFHANTRVAGNLDYQFDLFGQNRAALAAATSDTQAAQVDVAAAGLTLSTAVAGTYADLMRLSADRAAAEDAVRVREQSAELVRQRVQQELENQGQLSQAEAEVGSAQADLDQINGQIAVTRDAIAALLGKGPDRGLDIPVPSNPHLAPLGLPPKLAADLIGRRPDIVSARLRAEAAGERIKVARAAFYPNIDLSAYYGLQSIDVATVLQKSSIIGQIGPAIHLPIFDGGAIAGRYRGARATFDEAVATYDKTLTGALRDVADAVADERATQQELAHSRQSLSDGENAYRIARLRYQGGLSRYLDVLTAEDTLLTERRRVADLSAQAFAQDVALVRALGGGFTDKT